MTEQKRKAVADAVFKASLTGASSYILDREQLLSILEALDWKPDYPKPTWHDDWNDTELERLMRNPTTVIERF